MNYQLSIPSGFFIAGVDEAGRGPLAGPVFAAAVILNHEKPIFGLDDSKKLTAKRREVLMPIIRESAIAWAVAEASVTEIDSLNILQATLLAMQRAIAKLSVIPHHVLIDGDQLPKLTLPQEAIIGGDQIIPAISAASILAKVCRDRVMLDWDKIYPQYGFALHKGYGTERHLAALQQYGATPIHRCSFAPVKNVMSVTTTK